MLLRNQYAAEIDLAMAQYAKLQQRTGDVDIAELNAVRQAVRTNKERETVQQLKTMYGKRFDFQTLVQSRKDIATMFGEAVESASIQQQLQLIHAEQKTSEVQTQGSGAVSVF